MARHSVLEPPEEHAEPAELRKEHPAAGGEDSAALPEGESLATSHKRPLFNDSLLELSETRPRTRALDIVASFALHFAILGVLLLIPLYFTDAIDLKQFAQTMLVAPPPPPPPAAPVVAKVTQIPKRVLTVSGKLVAPVAIPQKVAMIKEEQLPQDIGLIAGVAGGVPGGVPGGQVGGVLGGILGSSSKSLVPLAPPSATTPKAPVRVGGRIREPRAILKPDPVYPPLARQARLQGDVQIDAVIDESGNVIEMQAVAGHPLLIPAAMDALKRWRFQPTILNDEPIRVQLLVTLRFRLG